MDGDRGKPNRVLYSLVNGESGAHCWDVGTHPWVSRVRSPVSVGPSFLIYRPEGQSAWRGEAGFLQEAARLLGHLLWALLVVKSSSRERRVSWGCVEEKQRTPLSSRVATRVTWSPLSGLKRKHLLLLLLSCFSRVRLCATP